MDSAEVKFDTPVDIIYVYSYLKTYGKDANVIIKFYTAGNSEIRRLNHYIAKAEDGSRKINWKLTSSGWEWDVVSYSNYNASSKGTKKPMIENFA